MDPELKRKIGHLLDTTRVMTLAVCRNGSPWSSPVYFVFHAPGFYFFSHPDARHIRHAQGRGPVAASVFHDADRMDEIFGFQMTGSVDCAEETLVRLRVVRQYVAKFRFLEQVFGRQILENRRFFQEKFHSRLYSFVPDTIVLSDNSRVSGKRKTLDPALLK